MLRLHAALRMPHDAAPCSRGRAHVVAAPPARAPRVGVARRDRRRRSRRAARAGRARRATELRRVPRRAAHSECPRSGVRHPAQRGFHVARIRAARLRRAPGDECGQPAGRARGARAATRPAYASLLLPLRRAAGGAFGVVASRSVRARGPAPQRRRRVARRWAPTPCKHGRSIPSSACSHGPRPTTKRRSSCC